MPDPLKEAMRVEQERRDRMRAAMQGSGMSHAVEKLAETLKRNPIRIEPTPELDLSALVPKGPPEHIKSNWASSFFDRLTEMIAEFDADLDDQHEVGVRLVTFGQSIVFHLQDLGFYNPSLISFRGETDGGDPVQLIQHVSQISVLLMKMKRKNPEQPKKPIGFGSIGDAGGVEPQT